MTRDEVIQGIVDLLDAKLALRVAWRAEQLSEADYAVQDAEIGRQLLELKGSLHGAAVTA